MKIRTSGKLCSWKDISSGTLFLCKTERHHFFGMKVHLPKDNCVLIQGELDFVPSEIGIIPADTVLDQTLLSFPLAVVVFDEGPEGILLSQSDSPTHGDLLFIDETVNLCLNWRGRYQFVNLAKGEINENVSGLQKGIIPSWSIVLETNNRLETLCRFSSVSGHKPSAPAGDGAWPPHGPADAAKSSR